MTFPPVRSLVLMAACLAAAALAFFMTPTERMADREGGFDVEAAIPRAFGEWEVDPTIVPVTISPEVEAKLARLYTRTLGRTYRNARGERVMLSIAYGANQLGESSQVHRPEYCYAAQGFQIGLNRAEKLDVAGRILDVRRLVAVQPFRQEPITYWMTVGETATLPGLDRRMNQLRYGLAGRIPDGLIFRVSSIGADFDRQWAVQERFVNDLLGAVEGRSRVKLVGGPGAAGG